ncbi:hypothetical protein [Aliidiomarina maris]|uniref:hypothetical protein n=1 Tax=Aliidiomarina maris TaxID=531312 RepID=UPI0015EBF86C|nr:hypothetical protein [Aliidiomarina maris]
MYDFRLGEDYPRPCIDVAASSREARERLWGFQQRSDVQAHNPALLKRHTTHPRMRQS